MANKIIYDFKKLLQEPETFNVPEPIKALKRNFKALNKNFDITAIWRQLNLLYVAAMKIVGCVAEGSENDFDNSKGEGGFTFLHYAVWANATGLVKTFLQHEGCDVNAQSDDGLTALQLAVIQNSPKILQILLTHPQIDLNLACLDGWTALHLAISYGYEELIVEILKFKTKLEIDARMYNEITPLHLAALLDKENLMKILLENGADVELITATGGTALKLAEMCKSQNAVEILRQTAATSLENSTTQAAAVCDQLNTRVLEDQPTFSETETSQKLTSNASKPTSINDFSADDVNDAPTLQLLRATFEGKVDEMKSLLVTEDNIDWKFVHKSGKNVWDFATLNGKPAVIACLLEVKNKKMNLTDLLFQAAKMGSKPIVAYLIEIREVNPQLKNAKNETLLCAAISSGNIELVLYLLEVHCLPSVSTAENCPLCEAVAIENSKLIDHFLEAGLPIAGVGDEKRPILHAAEKSNLKIFKYLLEKGADIEVKSGGKGVFDYAAIGGKLDIMLYLVKEKDFKFNANISSSNLSILFQFVRVGALENVKYLIEVEKLNFKHEKGPLNGTILHEAARNKNVEVIKYFVEDHDLNLLARDELGFVPLFYSVESNNLAAVKYFMEERNLSIYLKDKQNRTALHIAVLNDHSEIVRYLTNWRKNDLKCNNKTQILLDVARVGNLEITKFLIEEIGVDASVTDEKNRTALHFAALNGHMEIVRYLIEEKNSYVNAKDNDAATPLKLSIKQLLQTQQAHSGHVEVMKYLWKIVNGILNLHELVDVMRDVKFGTASATDKTQLLIGAAQNGNLTLLKFLIEDVGMDANLKDKKGFATIFYAICNNKLEGVKYFVECGKVDLHVKSPGKKTLREYARCSEAFAIESYLASNGVP